MQKRVFLTSKPKFIRLPRKISDPDGTCCLFASAVMVAMYWRINWPPPLRSSDWTLPMNVDAPEWDQLIERYQEKCQRTPIVSENAVGRFIKKNAPLAYITGFKKEPLDELRKEILQLMPPILVFDLDVLRGRRGYTHTNLTEQQPADGAHPIRAYHAAVACGLSEELIYIYDPSDLARRGRTPHAIETFIEAWGATQSRFVTILPRKTRRRIQRKHTTTLMDFKEK